VLASFLTTTSKLLVVVRKDQILGNLTQQNWTYLVCKTNRNTFLVAFYADNKPLFRTLKSPKRFLICFGALTDEA